MTGVAFPALAISKGDSVYLWESLETEPSCSTYAIVKGYWDRLKLYDAAGQVWAVSGVEPVPPLSPLGKFLAPICWNPRRKVRLSFGKPSPYELEALVSELRKLVDMDDDILTQFSTAEGLKRGMDRAQSFRELAAFLKKRGVV